MEMSDAILLAAQRVAGGVYPFAVALAAVGVLSMAFLQTLKDIFPLRRTFQAAWVRRWLEDQARRAPVIPTGSAVSAERAETDLIRLATSGDRDALYDLPIEQVTGQMNAAAQLVLDFPWRHEHLFRCLAAQADVEDLRRLLDARPPERGPRPALGAEEKAALIDARNRVTHQVQRGLDGLQIAAGYRWKLWLQVASITLSGVLVGLGLLLFARERALAHLPIYLAMAVVGGFVAPVARDLVAALQQLRK